MYRGGGVPRFRKKFLKNTIFFASQKESFEQTLFILAFCIPLYFTYTENQIIVQK